MRAVGPVKPGYKPSVSSVKKAAGSDAETIETLRNPPTGIRCP